jgi:transaldolase
MKNLATLRVKIYADGADKQGMLQLNANPIIKGLTTNPTLMRKAGLNDFEAFARDIFRASPKSRFRSKCSPMNFPKCAARP